MCDMIGHTFLFGTHGSFATRTRFSLSLIHFSLPYLPTSLSLPSTPIPGHSGTQDSSLFILSFPHPPLSSGHSGILGGLTTLEYRVVNESFSVFISTLAGGHPGILGGLITLEHRVIAAPILPIFTHAGGHPGILGGLITLEYRVIAALILLISTLAGGHSGTLGGLITLEHRVIAAPILSIFTLAGGHPGILGGLITLEHRVVVAPILLSFLPLLKATQEHWVV